MLYRQCNRDHFLRRKGVTGSSARDPPALSVRRRQTTVTVAAGQGSPGGDSGCRTNRPRDTSPPSWEEADQRNVNSSTEIGGGLSAEATPPGGAGFSVPDVASGRSGDRWPDAAARKARETGERRRRKSLAACSTDDACADSVVRVSLKPRRRDRPRSRTDPSASSTWVGFVRAGLRHDG